MRVDDARLGLAAPAERRHLQVGQRGGHARQQAGQAVPQLFVRQRRPQHQGHAAEADQHRSHQPAVDPGRAEQHRPAQQEQRHPHRGHVVQGHRGGQRQPADRIEPQPERQHAAQAAPEVHRRHRGAQAAAGAARQQPGKEHAHQAAVEDDLAGAVGQRGELDARPHGREQQRREQHQQRRPPRRRGRCAVQRRAISRRYHSWKCCMPSSIGLWYGPTSSSPRCSSACRPASMRSAISSSSTQVSM